MTRILIADDHPLMLSGIEAVLRGTSYAVVAKVSDGAAVPDAVAATDPAILILDVQMPGLSGIEILRRLRARGEDRRVVLLTASLDNRSLLDAIELEADGIVLKEGAESLILSCLDKVRSGEKWLDRPILQRALDLTRAGGIAATDPLAPLAPRERAVARLVARGLRNKEVGRELRMSEGTVKIHLHRIYQKLEIDNRVELALRVRAGADGQ